MNEKKYAGLTLQELSKTHKDNEVVRSLIMEIIALTRKCETLECLIELKNQENRNLQPQGDPLDGPLIKLFRED